MIGNRVVRQRARLILVISYYNIKSALQYRMDFVAGVTIGAVWQTSTLVFAVIILHQFSAVGGWTSRQVLLLAAIRLTGHGFFNLFQGRILRASVYVQEGRIETFLLRPAPVHLQLQLQSFTVDALGDLLVALSLLGWAVHDLGSQRSLERMGLLLAGILTAYWLESAIHTCLAAAAFRFPSTSHWSSWIEEIFATFGNLPLSVFPAFLQCVFLTVVPLGFLGYIPAGLVSGKLPAPLPETLLVLLMPSLSLTLYQLAKVFWSRRLAHYEGVNT